MDVCHVLESYRKILKRGLQARRCHSEWHHKWSLLLISIREYVFLFSLRTRDTLAQCLLQHSDFLIQEVLSQFNNFYRSEYSCSGIVIGFVRHVCRSC